MYFCLQFKVCGTNRFRRTVGRLRYFIVMAERAGISPLTGAVHLFDFLIRPLADSKITKRSSNPARKQSSLLPPLRHCKNRIFHAVFAMAERAGFEPARGFTPCHVSSVVVSTRLTHLSNFLFFEIFWVVCPNKI